MAGEPDSASARLGLQARHTGAGSSPPPHEATRADLCGARSEVEKAHASRPPALRGEMAEPGGTHGDMENTRGHRDAPLPPCPGARRIPQIHPADGCGACLLRPVSGLEDSQHPPGFGSFHKKVLPEPQPAHCPPGESRELRHKTGTSGFYFWLCCWQFTTFLRFPICYLGIMQYC